MGLYLNRPACELIFVTRSMHKKLHREMCSKGGKISGGNEAAKEAAKEKRSIPILQFTKDGEFVKEWPSAYEAERQLGILQSNICNCLKGRYKSAGGFVWRYASSSERLTAIHSTTEQLQAASSKFAYGSNSHVS